MLRIYHVPDDAFEEEEDGGSDDDGFEGLIE
jgi:hypothetical protein